jgi:hypothetical protein
VWFKVDDKLHSHRKLRKALRGHETKRVDIAPMGLWVAAGSWSGDNLTDGFVPEWFVSSLDDDWAALAARLVEARLWEPDTDADDEPGWRFLHWSDERPGKPRYNDTREMILGDRYAAKMRTALHRDAALVSAIKRRDRDRCRYCATLVNWNDKRGKAGATYDHVVPLVEGGSNEFTNVVVACKGCNDRKGRRSLEAAGMELLPPGSVGAPVLDEDGPAPAAYPIPIQKASKSPRRKPGSTRGSGRVGSGTKNVSNTPSEKTR